MILFPVKNWNINYLEFMVRDKLAQLLFIFKQLLEIMAFRCMHWRHFYHIIFSYCVNKTFF